MFNYPIIATVAVLGGTLAFWLMRKRNQFKSQQQQMSRTLIPQAEHSISRHRINDNALKVVNRLTSHGYEAYLVGGCVRDLYLDLHPKDFDVATNASPEDVRRIFRNSRIIGRRFKLVHILFGREMIEVATFRASHEDVQHKEKSRHAASGRILRDNVYGTIDDDVIRRDFTINALYYDANSDSVVDFCNGMNDLRSGTLRLIGDPETRYREDPVRMLRAVRFAAKLDFTMATQTEAPIQALSHLLNDVPSARLFDEALKLLQSGYGVYAFEALRDYHLFGALFPATDEHLKDGDRYTEELILSALENTDRRLACDKSVNPAFLFAALLWSPMRSAAQQLITEGIPPAVAYQQAANDVIAQQCRCTAIPKRFSFVVRDIWGMQIRLERRQPKTIEALLAHPKFRAAYDFLLLREQVGEQLYGAGEWWTDIQEANEHDRVAMIQTWATSGKKTGRANKSRQRRRKPNA